MTAEFTTPDWVKHAVFYQIFPERFAKGDPAIDPEHVQPWGTPPAPGNFMGGDLRGIINRLDYLADLGITALYLNPIFQASSNHKYNTYDYFRIDPHFGDLATFHELVEQVHRRGMYLILDGVFNHCGRGCYPFHNLLEQGSESPYLHWFHVTDWPLHPYDAEKPANYHAWWDVRSLPKFNTDHPPVRRYLLGIARYWLEQGADGWRLDVPNEIADHDFWREFRQVVKQTNPHAYITGEIWGDAAPWLDGTQFDAVMNYPLRKLCRNFFAYADLTTDLFAAGVEELLRRYPPHAVQAQLNLLGSHDTVRFRTEAGGDLSRVYPTILLQMTLPGAPCIYYGDEIGMEGDDDPDCRRCMNWERSTWDADFHLWMKRCIALRHRYPALRTGDFRTLLALDEPRIYSFARWDEQALLIIALNASTTDHTLTIPLNDTPIHIHDETIFQGCLNEENAKVQNRAIEQVHVPAQRGTVLVHMR